jgi:hypothetical protein
MGLVTQIHLKETMSLPISLSKLTAVLAATTICLLTSHSVLGFQTEEVQAQEAAEEKTDQKEEKQTEKKKAKEDSDQTDAPVVDTATQAPAKQVESQFAQLHLRDGSIIGGNLATTALHVKTEFGTLTVPVEKIVRVFPGLNSQPSLKKNISELVKNLGDPKLGTREEAQKQLLTMGAEIRTLLAKVDDGGNVERKKRLSQLSSAFASELEEEESTDSLMRAIIEGDTVETRDFAIVGEILEKEFSVTSKFGMLTVQLEDIRMADRAIKQARPPIKKSLNVNARAFFQTKPVSTKIRVNKGDRISIKASGVINWTNFSSSSSPDGITNRGQWMGINSGTLVARIGSDDSKAVKIGSESEFVAKSNGTLYLGIAMRDSYASNSGYNWDGDYKAKITITPK